jgi:hypothetical protein
MITNTGKNILAKYLIGQAPAYASYIALGCGAKPIPLEDQLSSQDFSAKERLDFEMFRVPIISRGYASENGVSQIVFTAELPTEERYEISEVGLYSAGANPSAGSNDSKTIYSFVSSESWEYHNSNFPLAIPYIIEPLDGTNNDNVINQDSPVFSTNADNRIFTNQVRLTRKERPRFLNHVILISGDDSSISSQAGHLVVDSGNHLHITGVSIDLDKNSPIDELKLAFSVVNKNGTSSIVPENVKIILEFASSDNPNTPNLDYARFEVDISNGNGSQLDGEHDFQNNRYVVVTKKLQELDRSSGFSWKSVNVAKIYASVEYNGEPSDQFYVALDALRLENVATVNPLYGLTGYSVIRSENGQTILKATNTTSLVEFRFAMDVQ